MNNRNRRGWRPRHHGNGRNAGAAQTGSGGRARALAAAGLAALAAAVWTAPAQAGPFEDGERAYLQQDYKTAYRHLAPLARKGHAQAQYLLGRQHQFGQGVKKSKVLAYYWYRRAEKGGHVEAGLFRHLLVSKWKMSKDEVAKAEKLLTGKTSTLAAATTVKPSPAKTAVAAKAVKPAPKSAAKAATVSQTPATKLRTAVRRTNPPRAKAAAKAAPGNKAAQQRAPYATAVVRPYPPNPPGGTGWRRGPSRYDCPDCTARPAPRRYDDDDDDDDDRAQRIPPRFQRWPGPAAQRYLYQLPPWQRRVWLRRHRWRVMNDPFYRRAWRAYRRFYRQSRRW